MRWQNKALENDPEGKRMVQIIKKMKEEGLSTQIEVD